MSNQEKKKPGCFGRIIRWSLIVFAVLLGIVVIMAVIQSSGERLGMLPTRTPRPTLAPTATTVPSATPTVTPTIDPNATATFTPVPEPTATFTPVPPTNTPIPTETPIPTYGIGEDVIVGDVRWKILSATNEGQTIKSDNQFIDDLTTAGSFIRIDFEIENLSKAMLTYSGIGLLDDQGRTFTEAANAYMHVPNELSCVLIVNLNPNVPKRCQIIYEVAANAQGFQVTLGDLEMFGIDEQIVRLGF